jgi:hypothetical protein
MTLLADAREILLFVEKILEPCSDPRASIAMQGAAPKRAYMLQESDL